MIKFGRQVAPLARIWRGWRIGGDGESRLKGIGLKTGRQSHSAGRASPTAVGGVQDGRVLDGTVGTRQRDYADRCCPGHDPGAPLRAQRAL